MVSSTDSAAGAGSVELRGDLAQTSFVWFVSAVMSLLAMAFVHRYGSDIPQKDDWNFVDGLLSANGLSVHWLWSQFVESRVPLQKLLLWITWHLTGGGLHYVLYLGVVPMILTSAVTCYMVRRIRGRMEYSDAIFPLLLLNWGHASVFLNAFRVSALWYVALILLLTLGFLVGRWRRSIPGVFFLGCGLLLLVMQHGLGLLASSLFAVALLVVAFERSPETTSVNRKSTIALALFFLSLWLVYMVLNAAGYERPGERSVRPAPVLTILMTSGQFLTSCLGSIIAKRLWPLSGIGVIGLLALVLAVLVGQIRNCQDGDRVRTVLVLLALLSAVPVALGVGWGRNSQGGFFPYYTTYATPLVCVLYFSTLVMAPRPLARFVAYVLFAAIFSTIFFNFANGTRSGKDLKDRDLAFRESIAAKAPLTQLVAEGGEAWGLSESSFSSSLQELRRCGIPPFDEIVIDEVGTSLPVDVSLLEPVQMTRVGNCWRGEGPEAKLLCTLSRPTRVSAIRMNFKLKADGDESRLVTTYRCPSEHGDLLGVQSKAETLFFNPNKKERVFRTKTVWIADTIDSFAISPSAIPFEFQLQSMELLVPQDEAIAEK